MGLQEIWVYTPIGTQDGVTRDLGNSDLSVANYG